MLTYLYGCFFSWLNWDWVDNSNVLTWLAETLLSAEEAGEKVHIMSHIPPGNQDCLGAWGRQYARVIERLSCH
jgi:sphingomyelin phosphodiesterase